jgi:hypothetical protein
VLLLATCGVEGQTPQSLAKVDSNFGHSGLSLAATVEAYSADKGLGPYLNHVDHLHMAGRVRQW